MGEWAALVICISVVSFASLYLVREWKRLAADTQKNFLPLEAQSTCVSLFLSSCPFPDMMNNCDLQQQYEPVLVQGSNPVENGSLFLTRLPWRECFVGCLV